MSVPNWGFEELVIYKSPYRYIYDASAKVSCHYYYLLRVYNRHHKDINIMYNSAKRILNSIEQMSKMTTENSGFDFARFIKPNIETRMFTWRLRDEALVSFEGYAISKSILQYMKFMNCHKRIFKFGHKGAEKLLGESPKQFNDLSYIDMGDVFDTLEYLFQSVNEKCDFNEYIDYWASRVMYDVSKGNIFQGVGSERLNKELKEVNKGDEV